MATLLARGECRRGHLIRSDDDLVGSDLDRRCRRCRNEAARLFRVRKAIHAYVERNAASARYRAKWAAWVEAGAEGPMPRLPAILR
jgi:hypothetical protein